MSNTEFHRGDRIQVTIPNPYFSNVAPRVWETKVQLVTVYGNIACWDENNNPTTVRASACTLIEAAGA